MILWVAKVLQAGWIALFFNAATGEQVSRPPYFVFESQAACLEDVKQLAQADKLRIECRPGTVIGRSD